MKKMIMGLPLNAAQKQRFDALTVGWNVQFIPKERITQDDVTDASVIIGNAEPTLLAQAHKLEWMQLNSAGTDRYVKPGILPAGVQLTNATGAYGLAVSEHMLASLFMLQKKLHLYRDNMHAQRWHDEGQVTSIEDSKTLVLGTGDIGTGFAKRMTALGSTVYGVRRRAGEPRPYFESMYALSDLPRILPEMDIVAVILPGTPELANLFDAEMFAHMKPGAFFLNAGRGVLVDLRALEQALTSGALGGAALDVTQPEPLPAEHPIWHAPNLLITPHVAGDFHLQKTLEQIIDIALENLEQFCAGQPLNNQVKLG